MLASVFDEVRLVNVSIHVGEALTEAEVQSILALIERQAAGLKADPKVRAVSLIIVESDNAPDAHMRRRIGEASRRLTRSCQVLVTASALVRMAMTAIRWFSPPSGEHRQFTCASYQEARAWLVEQTGHSREFYDELHARARAELGRRVQETKRAASAGS